MYHSMEGTSTRELHGRFHFELAQSNQSISEWFSTTKIIRNGKYENAKIQLNYLFRDNLFVSIKDKSLNVLAFQFFLHSWQID